HPRDNAPPRYARPVRRVTEHPPHGRPRSRSAGRFAAAVCSLRLKGGRPRGPVMNRQKSPLHAFTPPVLTRCWHAAAILAVIRVLVSHTTPPTRLTPRATYTSTTALAGSQCNNNS